MSTHPDPDGPAPGNRGAFVLRRDRLQADDAEVVVPVGELDIATAGELELGLELAATTGARRIVLDLRELLFIDSSGINAILEAYRRLGDRLLVVQGPEHVQRVFALCGLDARLVFVDGLPDAQPAERDPEARPQPAERDVGARPRPGVWAGDRSPADP
ncbi:MAG TPA: STAS domain-containing protein [Solirubrobacteraceae bacterium]|jgi:anti-sigma B factor antagonist|nr:STAS domain-containing protein [Solirubrobacteraceae bacterium]